ncbi:MAG: flavin reductase family protein [Gammaproteobacteria bacterium]|jgi:flavin reductase (DIM6/NTAB) family NADH-FMN oxidoreductase RutF|nr:flavin reductase family protein [Gammaproteobacteria bacterium]
MKDGLSDDIISLDLKAPIWERFFLLAPMVLIGTIEPGGAPDLAPKHMATPMGWDNYFGFVCTPRHGTYKNIERTGVFTVTYPRPSQILYTSLAASPRCGEDEKPVLNAFKTMPATRVDGVFVADGYVFLECEVFRIVDGFGVNSLITGNIVAAHVHKDALRASELDDQELIRNAPMFAYIHPWRFASVTDTNRFPLPVGMER